MPGRANWRRREKLPFELVYSIALRYRNLPRSPPCKKAVDKSIDDSSQSSGSVVPHGSRDILHCTHPFVFEAWGNGGFTRGQAH
jgi:hypothetical protein